MKFGPETKFDKRDKLTSKNFDVYIMSEKCDVVVIFRLFGQFGAVRRPDSEHRICNSNLFFYED